MKLQELKCEPCRGDTPLLSLQDAQTLLRDIHEWTLKDKAIEREFRFKDFKEAMRFVNQVAEAANKEDHHPDIHIYYNKVRIELSTHKIKGLSKNDFILAAKIDALVGAAVAG
jgi:4a-hydroxytetrahydrobiopterin dehydratase